VSWLWASCLALTGTLALVGSVIEIARTVFTGNRYGFSVDKLNDVAQRCVNTDDRVGNIAHYTVKDRVLALIRITVSVPRLPRRQGHPAALQRRLPA
jgi:hypothetical protein